MKYALALGLLAGGGLLGSVLLGKTASAQANSSSASGPRLSGVIDIHAHCEPDVRKRSVDAIQLARLAKAEGMRAVVFKNHYLQTASTAYLVRKVVPGIELYGGIVLNRSVGGLNPAAIETMAQTSGGYGRIVWMPTFDSRAQVTVDKASRPFVRVSQDGKLLPATKEVIATIAKYHLILATGHNYPDEDLMMIRQAKQDGVAEIEVTHPMLSPIHMSIPQMQEAAKLGAYLEFVYNGIIGGNKEFSAADYAKAIRAVGVDHCILASDLGQPDNPVHTVGLIEFFRLMRQQGFTQAEIDQMSKVNPAKLLGLK